MSDLSATGCGCGGVTPFMGGNSMIWIIILLLFCGGDGFGRSGCGGGDNILWILILLCCCGGGGGFGAFGGNNGCCI